MVYVANSYAGSSKFRNASVLPTHSGRIRGKSSEFQILLGGHYDTHFWGFQDDCCAVGLVLAAAKAMLDMGFEPENDIVFCLHGAEEWGK